MARRLRPTSRPPLRDRRTLCDPQLRAAVEGLINVLDSLLADYKHTLGASPNNAASFTLLYRMAGREYDSTTGLY